MSTPFLIQSGAAPIFAAAVHDGHATRADVTPRFHLNDQQRRHEEDPFTGEIARAVVEACDGGLILGGHSRFEVDLNRPRDGAVYRKPEDAWGLQVWDEELEEPTAARSLQQYDAFYVELRRVLDAAVQRFGRVVVYDLHSYNHRRDGAGGPEANAADNPEVNIGTGTLSNRADWAGVIERLMNDLSRFDYQGRTLDVRENVKFRGGNFPRWIHENYPASVCAIAIEWKKFWMDEWTGKEDRAQLETIKQALQSTVPGVLKELNTR